VMVDDTHKKGIGLSLPKVIQPRKLFERSTTSQNSEKIPSGDSSANNSAHGSSNNSGSLNPSPLVTRAPVLQQQQQRHIPPPINTGQSVVSHVSSVPVNVPHKIDSRPTVNAVHAAAPRGNRRVSLTVPMPREDPQLEFKLALVIIAFFCALSTLELSWAGWIAIGMSIITLAFTLAKYTSYPPRTLKLTLQIDQASLSTLADIPGDAPEIPISVPHSGGAHSARSSSQKKAVIIQEPVQKVDQPVKQQDQKANRGTKQLGNSNDRVRFANVIDQQANDAALMKRASNRAVMEALGCDGVVRSMSKRQLENVLEAVLADQDSSRSPEQLWLEEQAALYAHIKADTDELQKLMQIPDLWKNLRIHPNTGEMHATSFTKAMLSLGAVIDAFGSALKVIKLDWNSKCAEIEKACIRVGTEHIQPMVLAEINKKGPAGGWGTDGILWMKRTLQFIVVMSTGLTRGVDLGDAVDFAYKTTLFHVHPFLVQKLASNIKMGVPTKAVFVERLYPNEGFVMFKLREFVYLLRPKINPIIDFLNEVGPETVVTMNCEQLERLTIDHFSLTTDANPNTKTGTIRPKHRRTKTIG